MKEIQEIQYFQNFYSDEQYLIRKLLKQRENIKLNNNKVQKFKTCAFIIRIKCNKQNFELKKLD